MKPGFALVVTVTATTAVPLTAQTAAPTAPPGRYFASCDALTRAWPNGVARGPVAANAAVHDAYSRPDTNAQAKAVYLRNASRLDRDGNGTACEN